MTDRVTCSCCGTIFTDVFGPDQADGCATEVTAAGLTSHYGSNHDDESFVWVARPEWAHDGIACDTCLEKLIASGAAVSMDEPLPDEELDETDDVLSQASGAVVCASCHTPHEKVYSLADRQALGCAAEAEDRGVRGHYGSRVCDGTFWRWQARPEWVRTGVICDGCLHRLIDAGAFADRDTD